MAKKEKIKLFYDGECPICTGWAHSLKLDELEIIDARETSPHKSSTCDINKGMILKIEDKTYHGAAALQKVAQLQRQGSPLYTLLSIKPISRLAYPPAKLLRDVLLKLLGKSRNITP